MADSAGAKNAKDMEILRRQLKAVHEELARTNSELLQLTLELDDRVEERTLALRKSEAELREHRDHLEHLVEKRTAQLKQTNEDLQRHIIELRASEERFQSLVRTIPDIVYRITTSGRFVFINEAVTRLGYRPEELVGKHFSELILPLEQPALSRDEVLPMYLGSHTGQDGAPKLVDERRTGVRKTTGLVVGLRRNDSAAPEPAELEYLDSEMVVAEINSTGLYQINGKEGEKVFIGTVGVIRDISARLAMERQLKEANETLEQKVEERTRELVETNKALRAEIEERRKVEALLRESERNYKTLFEQAADSVFLLGMEGQFIDVNERGVKKLGYSRDELLSMRVMDIIRQEDNEAVHRQKMEQLMREGKIFFEISIFTKEGREIPHEVSSSFMRFGDTPVVLNIARDVTERKKAADAIAAAKKEFETIFENSQVGIMLLRGGRFLARGNQRLADILGYSCPEEMAGISMREFHLSEKNYQEFGEKHHLGLALGEQTQIEYQMRRKDGGSIWCSLSGKALNPADLDLGVIWVVDDLSSRKALEEALYDAKDVAEAANQAKSLFLANMSHELRTPLNGVLGMLQLIKSTSLDAEQGEYADMAIQSCQRLTRLLSDILDLSRVEAGRMGLQFEAFAVNRLFVALENMFLPVARQSGIELRQRIDAGLPEYLQGDATRLQQVLTNLMGNAFKFTNSGSVLVEAWAMPRHSCPKCRVLFSVSDTGPGISDEKLDLIFSPFIQASQGFHRTHQGAGLGLSICKSLVDLMDGTICVDSEMGVGTTVYFCVPLDESAGEDGFESDGTGAKRAHTGLRILLAEDDDTYNFAATRSLEKSGGTVTSVKDGKAAIEALKRHDFDVVLMDVQMPVMDGVEATRAIRGGAAGPDKAGIHIIALTAYAMAGDRELFLSAGMDDYLSKPVAMEELERLLMELLLKHRSR